VRLQAAVVLGKLHDTGVPSLVRAISDENDTVRGTVGAGAGDSADAR